MSITCKFFAAHNWKKIKTISATSNRDGWTRIEIIFEQCIKCSKVRSYVTNGRACENWDVGFSARYVMRYFPEFSKDTFIIECSKL